MLAFLQFFIICIGLFVCMFVAFHIAVFIGAILIGFLTEAGLLLWKGAKWVWSKMCDGYKWVYCKIKGLTYCKVSYMEPEAA